MAEKEMMRGTSRKCLTFSWEKSKYENWRMLVEYCLMVEEEYLKYHGIEIRLSLKEEQLG